MSKKTLLDAEKILADFQAQSKDIYDEFQAVPEKLAEAHTKMGKALLDKKSTGEFEKQIFALTKQRNKFPSALEELNNKINVAKQEVMDLRRAEEQLRKEQLRESELKNTVDAEALEIIKLMIRLRELFIAQRENKDARERYESFPQFTETIEKSLGAIKVLYPEIAEEAGL